MVVRLLALLLLFLPLQAMALDHVVLQLKWDHEFQFAGFYAAQWQGYYRDAGLEVELRSRVAEDGTLRNVLEEVEGWRADFAVGGPELLVARDQGKPVVILATLFQQSPIGYFARADLPLTGAKDFAAKEIVEADEFAKLELASLLDREQIGGVRWRRETPSIQTLLDRRADIIATYRPSAKWAAREQGIVLSSLSARDLGSNFYGDLLYTLQPTIDRNPELVQRFREASLAGWSYALDHPEEIADRITAELPRTLLYYWDLFGYNRFAALSVQDLMLYPLVEPGYSSPERWRSIHRQLREHGLVSGEFDPAILYTPAPSDADHWNWLHWFIPSAVLVAMIALLVTASRRHLIVAASFSLFCVVWLTIGMEQHLDEHRHMDTPSYAMHPQELDGDERQATVYRWPLHWTGGIMAALLLLIAALRARHLRDRERSGRALIHSEARFRNLFEHATDAVFILDRQGRILEANHVLAERLGYPRESLIGKPLREIESTQAAAQSERMAELFAQGSLLFESEHVTASGELIPVEISARFIEHGDEQTIFFSARDIRERKAAAARLESQNRQLQAVNRLSRLANASIDLDDVLTLLLNETRAILGCGSAAFWECDSRTGEVVCRHAVGATARGLTGVRVPPGEGIIGWVVTRREAICMGDVHEDVRHYEDIDKKTGYSVDSLIYVPLLHQDSLVGLLSVADQHPHRFCLDDLALMEALGGAVAGALANAHLFSELQRAKELAESSSRAKSAFLANMSHELRTPMNAMLGFAQILQRDPALGSEQRQRVESIRRSGDHLLQLINDILDLAKIEAGRLDLVTGPCSLPALLAGMAEIFRMRVQERGIGFRLLVEGELPRAVTADERRLRQILLNLLGNAVKFTEQGEVRLEVRYEKGPTGEPPESESDSAGEGGPSLDAASSPREAASGWLHLAVVDTGIGIPADRILGLFRPFQQEGTAAYRNQGTGLGLAITKSLIEEMGGTIHVESELGKGSRFVLRLPLPELELAVPVVAVPAPAAEITGYRRSDGQTGPLRILVVDDVADNRHVARGLLAPLGFEVAEAESGELGVAEAQMLRPDLILMDLVMPGIDGLEATQRILATPGLERMPVVALSASAFEQDRANSRAAGCKGHVAKPVQRGELVAAIGPLLPLEWQVAVSEPAAPERPLRAEMDPALRERLLGRVRRGDIRGIRAELDAAADAGNGLVQLREAAARMDLRRIKELLDGAA